MAKESDNWDEAIDGLRTSARKAREAERTIKKSVLELTRKKKNKTDQVCSADIVVYHPEQSLIFVHRSRPVPLGLVIRTCPSCIPITETPLYKYIIVVVS